MDDNIPKKSMTDDEYVAQMSLHDTAVARMSQQRAESQRQQDTTTRPKSVLKRQNSAKNTKSSKEGKSALDKSRQQEPKSTSGFQLFTPPTDDDADGYYELNLINANYDAQLNEQLQQVISRVEEAGGPKDAAKESDVVLLDLLNRQNPKSLAFDTLRYRNNKTVETSLTERLMEFELERLLSEKSELIKQRSQALTKPFDSNAQASSPFISSYQSLGFDADDLRNIDLSGTSLSEAPELLLHRRVRERAIDEELAVPLVKLPVSEADLIDQEIRLAGEALNTKSFALRAITRFYDNEAQAAKLNKFKTLQRYARFAASCATLDRSEQILSDRLTRIDKRYEIAKNRLVDLRLAAQVPQSRDTATQMKPLQEKDFERFTRHHVYNMAMKKHIDRFTAKMKWVSYSERFNLFRKAFETEQISKQNNGIPRLTVSAEEIGLQFQDLKHCFDLERVLRVDEYGQEFLYRVSKNFNVVFAAQSKNMKLWPYPGLQNTDAAQGAGAEQDGNKKEPTSLKYVYLKPLAFDPFDYFSQNISEDQVRQQVVLRETVSMDTQLRSEAAFLGTFDATYASRRLQNQAETHFNRAYIKHIVATEDDEYPFQPVIEGGKQTINQLSAVYMLRFNRVREFRKKVFDILNFFRSVLRRLTLDKNGFGVASHKQGIPSVAQDDESAGSSGGRLFQTQRLLTDPSDLYPIDGEPVSSNKASMQSCFRDDVYELINGREIVVRDSNGLQIVYQESLKDLELLEQELVNIGSFFIYKNTDKPLSKTLTSKFDVTKGAFVDGPRQGRDEDGAQYSSQGRNIPREDIEIDRFMVLEDLYESEAWFQDGKRKVIECYLEAYEHCADHAAQQELAQIIVDLIRKRPVLDLENCKYFTENYASEILASELTYSLMRDILQHQVVQEQDYSRFVHRIKAAPTSTSVSFSQSASNLSLEETFGHPLELLDDANIKMSLLPGATRVAFSDFFCSLSNVISVYHAIDNAVSDIKQSFGIKDPAIVSALHRTILQQAIVEWKLLVEEERIQRTVNLRMSAERRALENRILMEDASEIYDTAKELAESLGADKTLESTSHAGNATAEHADINLCPLQVYCNALEILLLWKNVNDQVFETDVVCGVHTKQCQVLLAGGLDTERDSSRNGKFASFSPILTDSPSQPQEANASDLAINVEFGREMADTTLFQTRAGLRCVLGNSLLAELRIALQYQVVQRSMISTLVRYNQILLDNYLLSNKLKKSVQDVFSLTAVPMENNPFFQALAYDSPSLDRMQLQQLFSNPNVFKEDMSKKMSDEYAKISANLARTRTGAQGQSRLREMRFQLVRDYISAANIYIATHAFKVQIIQTCTDIRQVLLLIPARGLQQDERGFVLGQDTDELQTTARAFSLSKGSSSASQDAASKSVQDSAPTQDAQKTSKASTGASRVGRSALAKDGLVANPFYVPHFIQVMRTEFGSSDSSSSSQQRNKVKSMQILRAYLEIMQVDNVILLLLWSRCRMSLSASEVVMQPQRTLDDVPQFIKHIFTEILYISNPEDPFSVRDYLLRKANTLFMRVLVSLLRLNETLCIDHKDSESSKTTKRTFDELYSNWGSAVNPVYASPSVVDDAGFMLRRGVDAELQAIVDRFDQGTLEERSPFLQPLSPNFQYYYWPMLPSLFTAPEKKFKDFRQLVENVVSLRFRNKHPFALLRAFLFDLPSGHRNLFHGIDHSIDELFDDILAEHKKYSATDSEEAGKLLFEVIRTQLHSLLLKNRYLHVIEKYMPPNIATNPRRMEAFYLMSIPKRSRRAYEKELTDHNARVEAAIKARSEQEAAQAFDTGTIMEITKPLNAHQRFKLSKELYEKELLTLKQEINKLLVLEQVRRSRVQIAKMRDEARRPSINSGSSRDLQALALKASKEDSMFTGDGKLAIFQSFLQGLAKHGVKNKTKTGSTAITIHEQDLQQALDVVGTKLKEWKEKQLEDVRQAHNALVDRHRRLIFNLEQKVQFLEYSRDLDKKSFMRRVSSEVVDKNYDLIFLVDTLTRENTKLLQRLIDLKEQAKNEVRGEYDGTVQDLAKELLALHAKFNDYKRHIFDRLAQKFADIKDDTIVRMAERKEGSAALKKRILQVVMEDNEGNRLQRLSEKHETDEIKLSTLHRLRMLTMKSKYESTIRSIEQEKEKTTEDFFGDKQQSEIRQNMLRQELIKVQTALSNTEKELSELRDELRLEVKNKERLRQWKSKHNELFQQLQKQIQQYERWSNVDVDKLILEVERKRDQVKNLSRMEQRVSKNAEIVVKRTKKQLEMMKSKLHKEQSLKSKAFQKLEEFKTELVTIQQAQPTMEQQGLAPVVVAQGSLTARSTETTTSSAFAGMAGHWQKRYYDVVSELNFALQDVEILRDALQKNGMDPNALLGRSERPLANSQPVIQRPTSSSSSRIPSISTTPSLSASTLRLTPNYVRSKSAGPSARSLAVRRRSTSSTASVPAATTQPSVRSVYNP